MRKQIQRMLLLPVLLLAGACGDSDTLPTVPVFDGQAVLASFSDYAALGNSLTAGYQSGAWGNPDHVYYSFPAQLARQLDVGGFEQVSLEGTGVNSTGDGGNMILEFDAQGNATLVDSELDDANVNTLMADAAANFDFNAPRNFGIPGITLEHAIGAPLAVYADFASGGNLYANAYSNSYSDTLTQVELAALSGAGLMTFWLGNNDVLDYVVYGGTGTLTDQAAFTTYINGALTIVSGTEYIVVLNIPSVTAIPYVTYANGPVIQQMDAAGAPAHAVFAYDDTLATIMYNIDPGNDNYLLLPALTAMQEDTTLGVTLDNPLPDGLLLDVEETAMAQEHLGAFNAAISGAVSAANALDRDHEILLLDVQAFFDELDTQGYMVNGFLMTSEFVYGGIFSLDGIHPSSMGYGMIANEIIASINEGWDMNIAPVDLGELLGRAPGVGWKGGKVILPDLAGVLELFNN